MMTATATFMSEDNQAQNGTSVKWFQIDNAEYADNGVYGIYEDGSIVDAEGYPISEDIDINEISEALERAGI